MPLGKWYQGIIQEFNLGVGSHVRITLWYEFCSWGVGGRGEGGCGGVSAPPPLFSYTSLLDSLLTTHSNFSVLNFKLGRQANFPFAWMFFFRTLAAAFPTSYLMKAVCSCWVWKLRSNACPLCIMHFKIQSVLIDYSFQVLNLVKYIWLFYRSSNW